MGLSSCARKRRLMPSIASNEGLLHHKHPQYRHNSTWRVILHLQTSTDGASSSVKCDIHTNQPSCGNSPDVLRALRRIP